MIQYKLIKEYPGSPKLGAIHWFQTDELGPSSNSIWKGTHFYNSHPEFWEKVEDFELFNKPMLSLNDLLNAWGDSNEIEIYKTSLMFKKFEALAKSKL